MSINKVYVPRGIKITKSKLHVCRKRYFTGSLGLLIVYKTLISRGNILRIILQNFKIFSIRKHPTYYFIFKCSKHEESSVFNHKEDHISWYLTSMFDSIHSPFAETVKITITFRVKIEVLGRCII